MRNKRTGRYAIGARPVKKAGPIKNKRFLHTLNGYAEHMKASYTFSASHKLPGSKGRLREAVVTEFLKAFMSRRFNVASNVFAVARNGHEHDRELDIVIHDSTIGGFWSLDRFKENSICTFEGISLVVEVKSLINQAAIDDAISKHNDIKEFCDEHKIDEYPNFVLFGFGIAPFKDSKNPNKPSWLGADSITDKAGEGLYGFDAIVCPDELCYVSARHDTFCRGFYSGISSKIAENDGSVQDGLISDMVRFRQYYDLGDNPGERLLALAAFASHSAKDDSHVQGMLSAALYPKHNPIFEYPDDPEIFSDDEDTYIE